VDWFSWATGGGDSHVIFSNEAGVAEVVVTKDHAMVLTDEIEKERLALEQVPSIYEFVSFPWAEPSRPDEFVGKLGARILSDRPTQREQRVTTSLISMKSRMCDQEVDRYRSLGQDANDAAAEALSQIKPEMSEWDLAGLAAQALWKRGIHPLLTLAAGDRRVREHRHPVASSERLERHAMLVVCGRRHGLFANLTRHRYFEEPSSRERELMQAAAEVESEAFAATEAQGTLADVYRRLKAKYASLGFANEIERHHQGGPTGYLSRESIANPSNNWKIETRQAFAWNPSLPGAKVEDTVWLNEQGKLEVLTSKNPTAFSNRGAIEKWR
jgi:Xaa-Pro aminopeptidase